MKSKRAATCAGWPTKYIWARPSRKRGGLFSAALRFFLDLVDPPHEIFPLVSFVLSKFALTKNGLQFIVTLDQVGQ